MKDTAFKTNNLCGTLFVLSAINVPTPTCVFSACTLQGKAEIHSGHLFPLRV